MNTQLTEEATAQRPADSALLQVTGLQKHFPVTRGVIFRHQVEAVRAVDGIEFSVAPGETVGLVGESGCGKTTTGRMLTRLVEPTAGHIVFDGHDITHLANRRMRPLRRDIQMIFQDPYSSLNPRHTVGAIVGAPFRLQRVHPEQGIKRAVQDLLERVGLNPEHYNRYPHEFSGGQRQRIGIARTLALQPKLIVADEPVSALDVSIQAQVINLLEDLQHDFGLTYVVIAHDLAVVRHIADRVAVMYLGKIVEMASSDSLYGSPRHPYTVALLSAVPSSASGPGRRERIRLTGDVPSPLNPPPACRFHTRCWKAQEICRTTEPPLAELAPGHEVACHFPEPAGLPKAPPPGRPGNGFRGRTRPPRAGRSLWSGPMDTGVAIFPTLDSVEPGALGRMIEERGHESLFFPEHTHIPASRQSPYPAGGELPRKYARTYDPFVALTAAAVTTRKLRIGTGICLLIERDPITTAKEVASIDHLSGGRFEFGVGAGWNREEMANHGTDPRKRMAILAERVEAMKAIWADDEASYHGSHVSFDRIWSWPKPAQRPHPPVLVGGNGPGVLDRVLSFGDAWFPNYGRDGVLERAADLRVKADRPVDLMVMGVPADPRVLERFERAGFRRVVHWLPSAGDGPVQRALDAWESAIAELRG